MSITIQEARKKLGKEAEKYTDDEVQSIINTLTVMADMAIDSVLEKRRKK